MKRWMMFGVLAVLMLVLVACGAGQDVLHAKVSSALTEEVCNYPRLHALATSNDPSVATNQVRLDAIGRQFDSATLGMSVNRWPVGNTGLTVTQYLEKVAPNMLRWVYLPGGFWWPAGTFDCKNHAQMCAVQAVIKDDDWMRKADGSYVTISGAAQRFLNPTTGVQGRIGAVLEGWLPTSGYDAVHWDLMTPTLDRDGGNVDLDGNGISDRVERGLLWLDAVWQAGHGERLGAMGPTLDVGNGAWQPGGSVYRTWLDGAFIELGHAWRTPTTGLWGPGRGEMLLWQLEQAQGWLKAQPTGRLQWVVSTTLPQDAYWSRYWNDYADAQRVGFAMAALTDGELVVQSPVMPGWCDECGVVVASASSATAGAGDWLGCARGPATCKGDLCSREFDGGMVFVNLGASAVTVAAPSGFRTIKGWYDPDYNNGLAWDGTLGGHMARVLVRTAVTPTPTQASKPTPTPTAGPVIGPPRRTPTATPTTSIEERLRKLEGRVDALETRVP